MTDTKPYLIERARETSPQRRRGMWLWILGVVVVAAGVLATIDPPSRLAVPLTRRNERASDWCN